MTIASNLAEYLDYLRV